MKKWQNFYFQRMSQIIDGEETLETVYESVSDFGIWCKDIPFKIFEKVKNPAVRTWNDEHGDDEYIPSGGLWLESYEMDVEFGCKKMTGPIDGASTRYISDVRVAVGNFLNWLRRNGEINLYSSWTRIGRQKVRLVSVDNDAHWEPDSSDAEFLVFKVRFKVNDPNTDIVLTPTNDEVEEELVESEDLPGEE